MQDALLIAWRDIRALREPDRFDVWLYRLLVRACNREGGRWRRRRSVEVHVVTLDAPDPRPLTGIDYRELLERAFHALSDEHRAALVVRHYLGLPDGEAADALGIPIGTYKSRLHRATIATRTAL